MDVNIALTTLHNKRLLYSQSHTQFYTNKILTHQNLQHLHNYTLVLYIFSKSNSVTLVNKKNHMPKIMTCLPKFYQWPP